MKWKKLYLLLLTILPAACSRTPYDYQIKGKILSDRYTPAITEVTLSVGDTQSISANKLKKPDFKTTTNSSGNFIFHLTRDEVYLNGVERVLGIQSSEGEKYIQILTRAAGIITNIGTVILWDAGSNMDFSKDQITISWTPLYSSSGISPDKTTFFLYCGNPPKKCWEKEIEDTGEISLSNSIPTTTPVCARFKGTKEKNNEILTYMSEFTCETPPETYSSLLTNCTFSINGEGVTQLNDGKISTQFTGKNFRKIDISCPSEVTLNKLFLYNFNWAKDGSPWNGEVTIGVINNGTVAGEWKITGNYLELDFDTPQLINNFSIEIMENDISISSASEVRGF